MRKFSMKNQHDINLTDYSKPSLFMRSTRIIPNLLDAISLSMIMGLLMVGCFYIPADVQQGENYKIMYVHVPSAWLSLLLYVLLASVSLLYLIYKHPLYPIIARSLAVTGSCMTALTLLTGSLWGLPVWGTYWVWDARLTSMLILLFFYLAYMVVSSVFSNEADSAKMSSILTLIGVINIPIIKFSVEWWNTLHQPSSISQTASSIDDSMSFILASVFVSMMIYTFSRIIILVRKEILSKKTRILYNEE